MKNTLYNMDKYIQRHKINIVDLREKHSQVKWLNLIINKGRTDYNVPN